MRGKEIELVAVREGEPTDAYGIPLSVGHAPQTALAVWQYVHQLEEPVVDPRRPGSPYTHICLLCLEEIGREPDVASPGAWTKALMRQRMSTNALKHLERRHPGVPRVTRRRNAPKRAATPAVADGALQGFSTPSASPAAAAAATAAAAAAATPPPPPKRARKTIKKQQLHALVKNADGADGAGADLSLPANHSPAPFQTLLPPTSTTPPRSAIATAATTTAMARSSPDQIHFLLHRWLLSSGLVHSATRNEELQRLLAVASNTPALELSSPAAFDTHLEMEFTQFARGVELYLSREREAACDWPLASLQYDVRTASDGIGILGVSIALVDAKWRHVVLPLVAQPLPVTTPRSRESISAVSRKAICEALDETYKLDVDALQKFSSVTADRTATLVQTRQEDDLIHAVSASLLCALGLVGASTSDNAPYSIHWLEHSLEKLLTFFQDPARRGKLYQIGEFYRAQPAALGEIPATTRLGYLYELFQRSCLNFDTYNRYFSTTPAANASSSSIGGSGDDGEVLWAQLAACDAWQTITEVEAILNQLTSQLELNKLHPRRVSSSYAHFFRRLIQVTLNGKALKYLSLNELGARPAGTRGTDGAVRESRPAELLTTTTRAFLVRLRNEIEERFHLSPSVVEIKAMMLDPRIKAKMASLVDDQGEVDKANTELRGEHRAVFMALAEREFAATSGDDKRSLSQQKPAADGSVGGSGNAEDSDEDEMSALLAMDGPGKRSSAMQNPLGLASVGTSSAAVDNGSTSVSAAMAQRMVELEQAEEQAWQRWQSLMVDWEHFASAGDIFVKNGQYNVVKLYQHVDVLSWFRVTGAQQHPSIAMLARVYLARPAVASAAHDAFVASLGDWDVIGLYTPGDVRREARRRVLQHSWRQWKELGAEDGFSGRRGVGNKRVTVV